MASVVEYLRRPANNVQSVVLWGRSMGAVTALLHGGRDHTIGCMVVDSPFSSLRSLALELVHKNAGFGVPKLALKAALGFIRSSVKSRAQFDIDKVSSGVG